MTRGAVPAFGEADVRRIVAARYGSAVQAALAGSSIADAASLDAAGLEAHLVVSELGSYIDQNFKVAVQAGGAGAVLAAWVWKAANASESVKVVEAEHAVMARLRSAGGDLRAIVPAVVNTTGGEAVVVEPCAKTGARHLTRMITFCSGTVFAKIPKEEKKARGTLAELGAILGRIDLALEGVSLDATVRFLRWDLKAAGHIGAIVPFVVDEKHRASVTGWMDGFEDVCVPLLSTLPVQVIYGDANDYNVLVSEGGSADEARKVTGMVDFGDIVTSPAVCELGIALAYFLMDLEGAEELLGAAATLVQAYHAVRPLASTELTMLWHLIAARLCTSITVASEEMVTQPDNDYCEISMKPAVSLLKQLGTVSASVAATVLHQACGVEIDAGPFARLTSVAGAADAAQVDALVAAWRSSTQSLAAVSGVLTKDEILAFRDAHCPKTLSVQYRKAETGPLKIVRGEGCYLIADDGTKYLDCVNNVCHVGHCHPAVVSAGVAQMRKLNTNTRWLSDNLVNYAKDLLATFPAELGLDTIFFTNSGTEANDLAYRLATTHTKQEHMVVVDHAYHGHSPTLMDISPYKFKDQGKRGTPKNCSYIAMPDVYRGQFVVDENHTEAEVSAAYAALLGKELDRLEAEGVKPAAFWVESLMGVGGQIVPPDGWLAACHKVARERGVVCIADEVQVGFGRVGTHWWAFQCQGGDARPDIVTLGKPIGNGHPMSCVITKSAIAKSFGSTGMEYFATFGGNPVSMAVGRAVLDTIKSEGLMEKARETGDYFCSELRRIAAAHPVIGHVRGRGMMIGAELVTDPVTKEPWSGAPLISAKMKDRRIIVTTDGPDDNVLKIKPPIVFDKSNVDEFIVALDEVLTELGM